MPIWLAHPIFLSCICLCISARSACCETARQVNIFIGIRFIQRFGDFRYSSSASIDELPLFGIISKIIVKYTRAFPAYSAAGADGSCPAAPCCFHIMAGCPVRKPIGFPFYAVENLIQVVLMFKYRYDLAHLLRIVKNKIKSAERNSRNMIMRYIC